MRYGKRPWSHYIAFGIKDGDWEVGDTKNITHGIHKLERGSTLDRDVFHGGCSSKRTYTRGVNKKSSFQDVANLRLIESDWLGFHKYHHHMEGENVSPSRLLDSFLGLVLRSWPVKAGGFQHSLLCVYVCLLCLHSSGGELQTGLKCSFF